MSSNMDFFGTTPVDRSVTTGSVATGSVTDSISDELTVRNAVSSADLSKLGAAPLPWANSSTGSAGVIRDVTESHDGAVLCRDFATTRHSYEGIAQFSGKTCLIGNGQWQLMMFRKQG
jgi:17 kDa outer membrane surface antigen